VNRLSSPELEPPKSCHQILGVDRGVTPDDLTRAFLRIAMPCHPAHGHAIEDPHAASRRLREAATAWTVLATRSINAHGEGADARALRALDEAMSDESQRLARAGARAGRIAESLIADGCPPSIAQLVAERAAAATSSAMPGRALRPGVVPDPAASKRPTPSPFEPVVWRDALGRALPDGLAHEATETPTAEAAAPRTRPASWATRRRRTRSGPEVWAPRFGGITGKLGVRRDDAPPIEDGADAPPFVDATLRRRAAACSFDMLLVLGLFVAPTVGTCLALGLASTWIERLSIVAALVGGAVLHVFGELGWGGSPGKRLMQLRVETERGGAPDIRTVWLRHGLRTMSCCLLGLGHLYALAFSPPRAVHDSLTSTRVTCCTPPRVDLENSMLLAGVVVAVLAVAAVKLSG
jgi:uncharacterized RDD family membrane protein YckC